MDRNIADTTLYRQFDKDGVLLYVGISLKVGQRTSQHRRKSERFKTISTITLEHFDTLAEARAAEKIAIDTEHPLWNLQRNFRIKKPKWVSSPPIFKEYPSTFGGVKLKLLPGGLVAYDLPATGRNA